MEQALLNFSQTTGVFSFMHSAWGWPVIESLHFLGLCLLIGSVGLFDLRLLGIGTGISYQALHRVVPFGVLGFFLNVITGTMFLSSAPDQYLYNPAFQSKLCFMAIAGINMLLFYRYSFAAVRIYDCKTLLPIGPRGFASISLLCWCGVIVCGRLITYYRPPYYWCFWC